MLAETVLDTDGDGIDDVTEGAPLTDSDGDGTPDYLDLDSNENGNQRCDGGGEPGLTGGHGRGYEAGLPGPGQRQ